MNEKLFSDVRTIERRDDSLQVNYTTKEVASRIWREHLRPRYKLLLIGGAAMIFSASTTGAIPLLIQMTADDVFVERKQEMVLTITLAVMGVTILKALSEYISNVTVGYLGHRFIADLRLQMFQRLTHADLSWLEDVHSGRFLSGFLNDVNLIRNTASRVIIALGENLAKVIVLSGTMLWLDWRLGLIMMICMPFGVYLLGRQRRKMRKSTTKSLQETGDLSMLITQTLRSIRVVRAYRQEEQEITRAGEVINRAMEFTMRGARARALSSPAVEVLTGIGFALAIYYAGTQGIEGNVSLGQFMGFMAAAMLIYQPLKSIGTLQTALQEGVAGASRVFGIIDKDVTIKEVENAEPLKISAGEITFENVDFAYEPGSPVLRNFSLKVEAGKTVALVGPSGAGKSTIFNLVLRFFDPKSGHVLIDGQDIGKTTMASLRDSIALVTQDPILFDDSLRANIAYGSDNYSQEAIEDAARAAAAHDFISAMPRGYDTRAGEAGNALSGGERQRVAIARAFLKDAPILLLDEPTSSLDSEAEAQVQRALETLTKGRTVLMIAHRLSTVKMADLICVIDKGQVVETGVHSDLIKNDGVYARLYKTQFDDAPDAAKLSLVDEQG